ncbi:MAG TPA: rhomboid family intramembrane serine protease [Rhizomicrobium sp.]|nr:rhomboid family intramembrane serine protease [Rhizomicrobium sp.]
MSFLQSQPSNPWTRQPIFRIPGVVAGLILVLAAAHTARWMLPEALSDRIINRFAFIPARYSHAFLAAHNIDPGSIFDRAIPFVSYMALHNDFTHLAINSLWLLAFGPIVARRLGGALFLGFFLICGIAAAATHLAFNWASLMPVIGASGAISGLMGAGMRLLPTQAPWAVGGDDELAPIFSRQIVIFTVIWLAINLAAGLTGFGLGPGELGQIAWEAHVGGYLAGLLLVGPFDRLRPRSVA